MVRNNSCHVRPGKSTLYSIYYVYKTFYNIRKKVIIKNKNNYHYTETDCV